MKLYVTASERLERLVAEVVVLELPEGPLSARDALYVQYMQDLGFTWRNELAKWVREWDEPVSPLPEIGLEGMAVDETIDPWYELRLANARAQWIFNELRVRFETWERKLRRRLLEKHMQRTRGTQAATGLPEWAPGLVGPLPSGTPEALAKGQVAFSPDGYLVPAGDPMPEISDAEAAAVVDAATQDEITTVLELWSALEQGAKVLLPQPLTAVLEWLSTWLDTSAPQSFRDKWYAVWIRYLRAARNRAARISAPPMTAAARAALRAEAQIRLGRARLAPPKR